MKFTLLILLICIGCSTPKETKKASNISNSDFSILGKWQFEWNKPMHNNFNLLKEYSTFNLLSFLGSTTLKNSTGKTIEFKKNNKVLTNLVEQELLNQFNFKYEFNQEDSLILFTAISPDDSSRLIMPTKIGYQDDVMLWNIADFLAIQLIRIE